MTASVFSPAVGQVSALPVTSSPTLSAQNVTVKYGQDVVLENFDLNVNEGELVVLLGSSGVGKSSLLRILAGLQSPHAGTVQLNGSNLLEPHPASAFAFQSPSLLPWLNVEKNVAFGLDFRRQPVTTAQDRRQRVQQTLEEVGLWHARHLYPAQLSGGMAQRVALARCFARQPKVLLLDEPFSALDEVKRHEMQALLISLLHRHRVAAVLITHDIDEALLLGDRVILLGREEAHRPAHPLRQWRLSGSRPRSETSQEHATLRLDVLRSLQAAQH